MKTTPLATIHTRLDARMAEFAGWQMPIQFAGIVAEHHAVRENVGVFDISHMGQFAVEGQGAGTALNQILTNDVRSLTDGSGQYTLMLNDQGGVIDDLIIYRESAHKFLLVVNAAKIATDYQWLETRRPKGVHLIDHSDDYAALAVQGPKAASIWQSLEPNTALPERNGINRSSEGDMILCRTGYTGEDGFELFAPPSQTQALLEKLLQAGATPCGLGARDTLRLEKGFPLNGQDLDPDHTPLEAGLGFFVKMKTDIDFIGRKVLEQQQTEGLTQKLVTLQMMSKSPPPRHDYPVFEDSTSQSPLSSLSSGGLSPTLGGGIAMAYLPIEHTKLGTKVEIGIRSRRFPAIVVKKPFV